jgi:hypothetical protein
MEISTVLDIIGHFLPKVTLHPMFVKYETKVPMVKYINI